MTKQTVMGEIELGDIHNHRQSRGKKHKQRKKTKKQKTAVMKMLVSECCTSKEIWFHMVTQPFDHETNSRVTKYHSRVHIIATNIHSSCIPTNKVESHKQSLYPSIKKHLSFERNWTAAPTTGRKEEEKTFSFTIQETNFQYLITLSSN